MKYKKVCKSLNKSITLLPVNEEYYDNLYKFMEKDPDADYYESIYTYSDEHKKTFDDTRSLAGIRNITTNRLVFDFDSKENVELARKDSVELISRLISQGVYRDTIQIFFSGKKGFHVELNTNEEFNRKQLVNIVTNLTEGLNTTDFQIYDEQRVLRLPTTRHGVTKLYKIPLTLDQLTEVPLDTIKIMAEEVLEEHINLINSWSEIELPKSILQYKNITEKEKVELKANTDMDEVPDFSNTPRHLSKAKFALQEGFYSSGNRHEALMVLASTYRGMGYNKEVAYNMLKATNRLQSRRTGQEPFDNNEIWLNIVEYIYSPKWKGGTYSDKDNPLLLNIIKKYSIKENDKNEVKVSSIQDVSERFINFAENIDKNRIELGLADMDEDLIITTGMSVGLLGCPGAGKTSHMLNIIEHNILKGNHCFFGSHDMYDSLLYTRLLQKYCDYDMAKILQMVQTKSMDKKLKTAWDQVIANYRNIGLNFQSSPTPEDIFRGVDEYEQKSGEKVKLLVVDYLEKVNSGMSDPTASSGYAASKIIDGAKDRDICAFILLQSQKSSGDASDPLLSMRKIKGASLIEQNLRVILSTWRPGFNPDNDNIDDKYCSFAILKNTMGPVGKYNFRFDGLTGRTRALTGEEERDMERVVKDQKDRKNPSSGAGDLF